MTDAALPTPRAAPVPAVTARPAPMGDDIPYRFERSHSAAAVVEAFGGLEAGTETDAVVSAAGRLMLRRDQGRVAFGVLQDATGRIQLFATAAVTGGFEQFTDLSIGDWIGVKGAVMATRRGQLSVWVDDWVVLARARRPFPDKWHGLTDPDTRYRQRYVDLWVSGDSRAAFVRRSQIVAALRRRHAERCSRQTLAVALADGYDAHHTADAVTAALARQPRHLVRTLTWDQGREMARWGDIEAALGVEVYFCEPRSPWQQPANEQTNCEYRGCALERAPGWSRRRCRDPQTN